MESLVERCVDVLARAALGVDGTEEPTTAEDVNALIERFELLPVSVGQCFSHHLQRHTLRFNRRRSSAPLSGLTTAAERVLWAAFVAHEWLSELRVAALPAWLQTSPHDIDWSALEALQVLDLSRLAFGNASVVATALLHSVSLDAVHTLNLSGADDVVTDTLLYTLATECQRVMHLDLSYCSSISEAGVSVLVTSNHKTLRGLSFNGLRQLVDTDGQLLDAINQCVQLEALSLQDCIGLPRLPCLTTKLQRVTHLDFHGLAQFSDHEIAATLAGCFGRLQRLELGESELSDTSLVDLVSSSRSFLALEAVDLSWCRNLLSNGISQLIRRSPSLTSLRLRCTQIDDSALTAIAVPFSKLRILDLERCEDATASGFERVASGAIAAGALCCLEKINLSWTNVPSNALIQLLSLCSATIRKLRLQGCRGVDHTLFDAIGSCDWPQLELVDCAWTNGASDEQLARLARRMPTVRWIGYYGTEIS